ncbi:MAG: 30S ribosome-binding factor RbfA [Coriobacteriia bacterium]|nr:30S ribosome-binding factor RbfA [Coriobacteriia bacterium]
MTKNTHQHHPKAGIRKSDEQLREVLALILIQEINDPRVEFVTITGVDLNSDRTLADVYVSAEKDRYEEALAGLRSAKGRIRSLAARALDWREAPKLRFLIDPSIDEGERIDRAILSEHTPE